MLPNLIFKIPFHLVDTNKYIQYRQTAQMLIEYNCICNMCMNDIINKHLALITKAEYLEKKVIYVKDFS